MIELPKSKQINASCSIGFLAGSWELSNRLIMGIVGVIIWLMRATDLLTQTP